MAIEINLDEYTRRSMRSKTDIIALTEKALPLLRDRINNVLQEYVGEVFNETTLFRMADTLVGKVMSHEYIHSDTPLSDMLYYQIMSQLADADFDMAALLQDVIRQVIRENGGKAANEEFMNRLELSLGKCQEWLRRGIPETYED
jgi:hypothetical protein